ncbi:MAG: tetratricopeptide repeat protein [Rhodobacteraceae bacterium]|nr:tetratricopeptide repeat protein [Paracoccaceae bacterium]
MKKSVSTLSSLAIGAFVCVFALTVHSAPSNAFGSASKSESKEFKAGEKAVEKEDYAKAVEILTDVIVAEPENADAYNYLAFSQRHLGATDEAMANYNKALSIDPEHKGALEYQGELFLILGDAGSAEANLAKLVKVCDRSCEERDTLQAAIERFKDGKAAWTAPDRGARDHG